MGKHRQRKLASWALLPVGLAALGVLTMKARPSPESTSPSAEAIACRVLETHTSEPLHVTVVVFHQREASDRARLGALLRQHSGATVQFQTAGGRWHGATVVRLKSCFGRGLLLFPAGSAQLAEKDEFALRFSPDAGK